MSYKVIAPLVIAKDQDGRPHHVYEGGVIQWLSDEQAAHFLDTNLVVESDSAGVDGDDVPDDSWKRDDIDAWAAQLDPPLDTTGAPNKAAALAMIDEALED